jgi:hypothetical protein
MNRSWKYILPLFVSACTAQVADPTVAEPETESDAAVYSNICRPLPRHGALVEAQLLLVAKEGLPGAGGVLAGGEVVAIDPYSCDVFARYQTGPNPFGAVGRRALIVLERDNDGALAKIRDLAGLPANPYWTTLDASGQIVYVSIPEATGSDGAARGGVVQAWKLTNCSNRPMWSTYVGGSAKRMALSY